jgi:aspartate/methionine/tyrosine aminotransferase
MPKPLIDHLISQRARQVGATLALPTAARPPGLITLSDGTPDFPTPPHIVAAGRQALADGRTTYTAWAGILPLREAIAEKLHRENGIKVDPATEIVVTAGAQAGLMATILALFDPGDELIVPVPFYEEYLRNLIFAGATLVPVITHPTDAFEVDPEAVARAITPRTKAILLVSPSNPTANVLGLETLQRLAEIAIRHDLLVIADELYERFVYAGFRHHSIAALPGMRERTVVINGFSKSYSMTGWRVGYVAARREVIDALIPITHGMTICAPAVSQWAALAACTGPHDWFPAVLAEYDRRRHLWMAALDAMGLGYGYPRGAYYILFDIRSTGLTSQEFIDRMRTEANVGFGGGSSADSLNEGFVRGTLSMPIAQIEAGLARMAPVVARLQAQSGG